MNAEQLKEKYPHPDGESWGQHPYFVRENWQYEVGDGDTILGYWEWVYAQIDMLDVPDLEAELLGLQNATPDKVYPEQADIDREIKMTLAQLTAAREDR